MTDDAFADAFADHVKLLNDVKEIDYFAAGASKSVVGLKPFKRAFRKARQRKIHAYDLETTNIAEGTPLPLYLTAYGDDGAYKVSRIIERSSLSLLHAIEETMLTDTNVGCIFAAWNGNRYDIDFVCMALKLNTRWRIEPSMTRSKVVRAVRIVDRENPKRTWSFLDGMAMTGLDSARTPLRTFIEKYAPEYPKLTMDFDAVTFDPHNPEHVAYADRDSEALYYALKRCNEIIKKLTGGNGLQTTMGRLAISYFQSKLPEGVKVWRAPDRVQKILHRQAKRGGYVWIDRQYDGPVWGYDINQAYAAAMRDCQLPCGSLVHTKEYVPGKCGLYRVRLSRYTPSRLPLYIKDAETGAARYTNGKTTPEETYLLSNEIEHARRDMWDVEIIDGDYWEESFNFAEAVNELEALRFTDPDGPSGALGTMVKQVGNNGYGKFLEELDGSEYVIATEAPDGFALYQPDTYSDVYFKIGEPQERPYHRPQIGCFITAHVRIAIREAALPAQRDFLYADTDGLKFTKPVRHLDIDPRRYGAWKAEIANKRAILIAKKVYFVADDKPTFHAKGLRVRELTVDDMENWFKGEAPTQRQLQRQSFVAVMGGQSMFRYLNRRGTDITKSKTVRLTNDKRFKPT